MKNDTVDLNGQNIEDLKREKEIDHAFAQGLALGLSIASLIMSVLSLVSVLLHK